MCGIFGIVSSEPVNLHTFQDGLNRLRHRGPDDMGIALEMNGRMEGYSLPFSDPEIQKILPPFSFEVPTPAAFGHTRLSIIDLSIGGHQPFMSEDGRFSLVFNGEIYNYKEIREELRLECKTSCDTEIVLKAFCKLGPRCVESFIGMWAFAIYDRDNRSLFLSRDPFGIKPLYFRIQDDTFSFASEIKALLSLSPASVNESAVYNFLVNEIKDFDDCTFFREIRQLEPGHNLEWNHGQASISQYTQIRTDTKPADIDTIRSRFKESMRLHIRSDVPFGLALSGGIDSTIIAGVLARDYPMVSCDTFSGIYPGYDIDSAIGLPVDESRYIEETVQRFGFHSHLVTPTLSSVRASLARMIWHSDQPIRVIGVALNAAIYEMTHKSGIKVLLGGQGADETFAGYSDCIPPFLLDLFRKGSWIRLYREMHALIDGADRNAFFHFLQHAARVFAAHLPRLARKNRRMTRLQSKDFLNMDFVRRNIDSDYFLDHADKEGTLKVCLERSFRLKLRDYLDYEDKMSMMFGVESRVPFLSMGLVRAGLAVPEELKIEKGTRKALLRQAFRDLIPESILSRKDKIGYGSPQGQWLIELSGVLRHFLLSNGSYVTGIIASKPIERMISELESGIATNSLFLWRLLAIELWHLLFIRQIPIDAINKEISIHA